MDNERLGHLLREEIDEQLSGRGPLAEVTDSEARQVTRQVAAAAEIARLAQANDQLRDEVRQLQDRKVEVFGMLESLAAAELLSEEFQPPEHRIE